MNPFASLARPIAREEEMDAAELPPARYAKVLADLSRINALTLAPRPTLGFLDRVRARGVGTKPWRILDVGFGVADAMAEGLLCIVGREGGPAELIRDGETGFVVDGRSKDAIARALDAALRHPALRTAMGLRARQWVVGNLSWRRHGQLCLEELQMPTGPLAAQPVRVAA